MMHVHFLEMHWILCCCGIQCVSKKCLLCLMFPFPRCSVRVAPARWGEPQLPLGEIVQLEQKLDYGEKREYTWNISRSPEKEYKSTEIPFHELLAGAVALL